MNLTVIKKETLLLKYEISENEMENELEDFIDYWTEPNKKWKERWQFEKTFEPNRRFSRWLRNSSKWNKPEKKNKGIII